MSDKELNEELLNENTEIAEKSVTKGAVAEIISWVKTIIFAVFFSLLLTNFVIVNASIPSSSMENTIMTGDRVVANRLSYLFTDPERLDIIIFNNPDWVTGEIDKLYVKRVIGLPGETLEIKDGIVYIDGIEEPIDASFVKETPYELDYGPYVIPENHYFMMGDNRNNSNDSRGWQNKFVHEDEILGKVVFRYYPNISLY